MSSGMFIDFHKIGCVCQIHQLGYSKNEAFQFVDIAELGLSQGNYQVVSQLVSQLIG